MPKNPYLYDNPGFDQGGKPSGVKENPNPINTSPPNYQSQQYYEGQPPNAEPYYGGGQPYQAPPQGYYQYQVPTQQNPYSGYNGGYQQGGQYYQNQAGSRYYSNPYAIPPAGNYYAPRYDADQHYRPPSYYGAAESSQRPVARRAVSQNQSGVKDKI